MNSFLVKHLPSLIQSNFPMKNVSHAFAYGSAVFKQKGNEELKENNKLMIDMIFTVDNSYEFHKLNLKQNPSHYSFLMRCLGPNVISIVQERFGANIYYNTKIQLKEEDNKYFPYDFKYGIINKKDLLIDLLQWNTLYVSGRLQKPTFTIFSNYDLEIEEAQFKNLEFAFFTSLKIYLQKKKNEIDPSLQIMKLNLFDLFVLITSLSYKGDVRMKIKGAENKDKVTNIVETNYKHFITLYQPIIKQYNITINENEIIEINKELIELIETFQLPKCIENEMKENNDIEMAIENVVKKSSFTQTLKGILTAGITKSIWYAFEKVKKGIKSNMKK
ncbi:hypothetical protein ABK040_005815 [Willaertia magna]